MRGAVQVKARPRRVGLEVAVVAALLLSFFLFRQSYGLALPLGLLAVIVVAGLATSRTASVSRWRRVAAWAVEAAAAVVFVLVVWTGVREGTSIHLVIGSLLAWYLALYTFKLATPRDLRFFALIPLGVAVFVAGLTSAGLFAMTGALLAAAVLAFVVGAPLLEHVGEEADLRRAWLRTWGRILLKTAAVAMLFAAVSEQFAAPPIRPSLPGAVGQGLRNVTPYQSPNFSYDIVPRLSYSGFSPYLRLDTNHEVHMSDEPAMEAQGMPTYWRGIVFDEYTGGAWEVSRRTTEPQVFERTENGYPVRPGEYSAVEEEVEGDVFIPEIRQVKFLKPHSNFLFTPWIPERISLGQGTMGAALGTGMVTLRRSGDGTIQTPFLADADFTYGVEVLTLRQDADISDDLRTYLGDNLHLPLMPPRVAQIAAEVVGEAPTAAVKMALLEEWLESDEFEYSLETEPVPEGEDAVHWFLTESKRGWCEMFASALAVMGRSVGVPTRVVGGYAGGEMEEGHRWRLIRDRDAHVWVEWWDDSRGWTLADPTPEALVIAGGEGSTGDGTALGAIRDALQGFTDRLTLAVWDNLIARVWRQTRIVVLAALSLFLLWRGWRRLAAAAPWSPAARRRRRFRQWERAGRRWAGRRPAAETISEFARRMAEGGAPPALAAQGEGFERALYGQAPEASGAGAPSL